MAGGKGALSFGAQRGRTRRMGQWRTARCAKRASWTQGPESSARRRRRSFRPWRRRGRLAAAAVDDGNDATTRTSRALAARKKGRKRPSMVKERSNTRLRNACSPFLQPLLAILWHERPAPAGEDFQVPRLPLSGGMKTDRHDYKGQGAHGQEARQRRPSMSSRRTAAPWLTRVRGCETSWIGAPRVTQTLTMERDIGPMLRRRRSA